MTSIYAECVWLALDQKTARFLPCVNVVAVERDASGRVATELTCQMHGAWRMDQKRIGEDPYSRRYFNSVMETEEALVALSVAVKSLVEAEHGWINRDLFAATYASRTIEFTELFRKHEKNRLRLVAYNHLLSQADAHMLRLKETMRSRARLSSAHIKARRDWQAVRELQEKLIVKGP